MTDRTELYSAAELLAGFDSGGFTGTWDFTKFRDFMRSGGPAPRFLEDRQTQASHDAAISHLLMDYLANRRPLVGIMGGHKVARDTGAYAAVARLAHVLADEFLVASGGGPGAMEAAHVGAAASDLATVDQLLNVLKTAPKLPKLINIVDHDGNITADPTIIADAEKWLSTAMHASSLLNGAERESLAIPTWLYGQEPTMPFATAYAKYFHNSIREEALVKQSAAGIIYARGGGGTLREIFQDVEENYYSPDANAFTPMIFFDPDDYWRKDVVATADGIDLDDLLRRIITMARKDKGDADACLEKIVFTTDTDEVLDVLRGHGPVASNNLRLMLEGNASDLYLSCIR